MTTTTTTRKRKSLVMVQEEEEGVGILIGDGSSGFNDSSSSSSSSISSTTGKRGGNTSSLIGLLGLLIVGQLCFSSHMLSQVYSNLSNKYNYYQYDPTSRIIAAVVPSAGITNGNINGKSPPPPSIIIIKNVSSQMNDMLQQQLDNNKKGPDALSHSSSDEGFGACLIVKDDNHWLVEWLAYHYFVLPLEHLVVYIDPNSKTSPYPIFDRWTSSSSTTSPKMNIVIWDDARYYPPQIPDFLRHDPSISKGRIEHYGLVNVQSRFIKDCMMYYKSKSNKKKNKKINMPSWIVLVDTDEFIAINDWTRDLNHTNTYRGPNVPSNGERGSVMKFLKQEQLRAKHLQIQAATKRKLTKSSPRRDSTTSILDISKHPACVRIHRQQMCLEEIKDLVKRKAILEEDWEYGDFLTYNFKYGERGRQVKNMVNVAALDTEYFHSERLQLKMHPNATRQELNRNYNIHNPLPQQCPPLKSSDWELGPYLPREQALFQAYHYSGTKAQREFRYDKRGEYGNRPKAGTPPPIQCLNVTATDLRPWLRGFIELVGQDDAAWLSYGVGNVQNWPPYAGPTKKKKKKVSTTKAKAKLLQHEQENNTLLSYQIRSKVLSHHTTTSISVLGGGTNISATTDTTVNTTSHFEYIRSFRSLGRDAGPLKFIHIPKTGGTSIEALAAQHNMTWGVCAFSTKGKNNDIGNICSHHHSRISADHQPGGRWPLTDWWHEPRQHYPLAGIDPYTNAELFTVVRNPYNRQISEFNYQCNRNYHCNKSKQYDKMYINEWLTNNLKMGGTSFLHLKHISPGIRRHYIPQYAFVVDGPNDDVRLVDHVLHMESMSSRGAGSGGDTSAATEEAATPASEESEFDRLVKAYSLPPKSFQLNKHLNSMNSNTSSTTSTPSAGLNLFLGVNDLIASSIQLINKRFPYDTRSFGYEVIEDLEEEAQPHD